jgi:serine/threonine-protein kinase
VEGNNKKDDITIPEPIVPDEPVEMNAGKQAGMDGIESDGNRKPESVREAEVKPVVIPVVNNRNESKPDAAVPEGIPTGIKPAVAVAGQNAELKPNEPGPERNYKRPKKKSGFLLKFLAVIFLLFLLAAGGIFYYFGSSKPDIVVADVNGKPVAEAQKVLEGQGFKVEVENKVDPGVKPGMVLRMDPVAGIKRKEGATITLVVSGTEEMIAVPKVVGLKQEQAEKLLSDKKLRIEKIDYKWDKDKPEGIILSQSPLENSKLSDNGAVDIIINKKEEKNVAVPDLKGLTLAEAKKKLEDLKLKLEVREEDSDKNKDTVIGMSPNANETITEGSTVILLVSNAKKKMPFPSTPEGINSNSGKSNGTVTVSKTTGARYAEFVVPGTGTHTVQIVSNNGRTQKVEVSGSYNGGVRLRTRVDSDVQRVGFYVDHRLVEEKSW